MRSWVVTIELRDYWHCGAGRGGGAVLDAVVQRDHAGVPLLPGRHLKGLLRDALERAAAWDWPGYAGLAGQLFGQRTEEAEGPSNPTPGCLRVSDACLPGEVRAWLADDRQRSLRAGLFRGLYATAIDERSGTAKDASLRGIEVVVPLQLRASLAAIPGRTAPPEDWVQKLAKVLPLIDAIGAHRSRGLGRAVLSLKEAA